MNRQHLKNFTNQKSKPPNPSNKHSKKLESLKSKLNEMSSRMIKPSASNRTRSSTRRDFENLDERSKALMKIEGMINTSLFRTKGIVFKQLSESMAFQLKFKLACHKIKKVVEERCRKQYLKFLEKLLFVADIEIDLSERSSLFRSTLTYSMRDSSTSMFKKTSSIVKNYINERSPDRKTNNKLKKIGNGEIGKSYGKSIRSSLEKIVSEIQEFKGHGNPKSSRLDKGLSDWDDILVSSNIKSGRSGYHGEKNGINFKSEKYFKGSFLKAKKAGDMLMKYKQISSGISSGEGFAMDFSNDLDLKNRSRFKKKLNKLEQIMSDKNNIYSGNKIDDYLGCEKGCEILEKIIRKKRRLEKRNSFHLIKISRMNFFEYTRPLLRMANLFQLNKRRKGKFCFKKIKFFQKLKNFKEIQKIKTFEKKISRVIQARKYEVWRNLELCVIEFYLIVKLLQENQYKITHKWKQEFLNLNFSISPHISLKLSDYINRSPHNRFMVRTAILNLTLQQIFSKQSRPHLQRSFSKIVQTSMTKRRKQVNVEFGCYSLQKIFLQRGFSKINDFSNVIHQKQNSFLLILSLLQKFEQRKKFQVLEKICEHSNNVIRTWEGGRILDGIVYQSDTFWLAEGLENIFLKSQNQRNSQKLTKEKIEKITEFVDIIERVEGCRMVEDLRSFYSFFKEEEERVNSSESGYLHTSSDSDVIYEDENENLYEIEDEEWLDKYIGMQQIEENPILELSELLQEHFFKDTIECLKQAGRYKQRKVGGFRSNIESSRINFLALERAKVLFKVVEDPFRKNYLKYGFMFLKKLKRVKDTERFIRVLENLIKSPLKKNFKEIQNFDKEEFEKMKIKRQVEVMDGDRKIKLLRLKKIKKFFAVIGKYVEREKREEKRLKRQLYSRRGKVNDVEMFSTLVGEEIKLSIKGKRRDSGYSSIKRSKSLRYSTHKLKGTTPEKTVESRYKNFKNYGVNNKNHILINQVEYLQPSKPPKPLISKILPNSTKSIKIMHRKPEKIFISRDFSEKRRFIEEENNSFNNGNFHPNKILTMNSQKTPNGYNRILNYNSNPSLNGYNIKNKRKYSSKNRLLNRSKNKQYIDSFVKVREEIDSNSKSRVFPSKRKSWKKFFNDRKSGISKEILDMEEKEERLIRKYSGNYSSSKERGLRSSNYLRRSYYNQQINDPMQISTIKKKPPLGIPGQKTISYSTLRQNLTRFYEEDNAQRGRSSSRARKKSSSRKRLLGEKANKFETPPRVFNSISGLGQIERKGKKGYYTDFVDNYIKKRRILG